MLNEKIVVGVVTLLLVGCAPETGPYKCELAPMSVTADFDIDCAVMGSNVEIARSILDARKILPTADFEQAFSGLPVHLIAAPFIEKVGDGYLLGTYNVFTGVTLSRNSQMLLHELLHHLDVSHGNLTSEWHTGWKEAGWFDADDEFQGEYTGPRRRVAEEP